MEPISQLHGLTLRPVMRLIRIYYLRIISASSSHLEDAGSNQAVDALIDFGILHHGIHCRFLIALLHILQHLSDPWIRHRLTHLWVLHGRLSSGLLVLAS